MRVLALISTKGGAGKTSLATAFAVETGGQLFDLDPQASACDWRDLRDAEVPVVSDVPAPRVREALTRADAAGVVAVVLDAPPRSESFAVEAARAADLVVVPCRAQMIDLRTITNTRRLLARVPGTPAVVVLVGVPPRGQRADQARTALERIGMTVCPHTIGYRAAWGDAFAAGQSVVEYEPRGRAASEFRSVAGWVLARLHQPSLLEVSGGEG